MNRGKPPKEVTEFLLNAYAEFRLWQLLGSTNDSKMRTKIQEWLQQNDYEGLQDKHFCKKHNIERSYTVTVKKKPAFKRIYHDLAMEAEYINLPIALNLLLRKYPDKWYPIVYPEEASARLIQRIEMDSREQVSDLSHLTFEQLYELKYGKKPK